MNVERKFKGKWITSREFAELEPVNVFHRQLDKKAIVSHGRQNAHLLFRRRFAAKGGRATVYISADDYYKLWVNGKFVAQGPAPGYPFHYYYNKIEVELCEGENVIAVHTLYQGLINRVWVSGDDRHGLIADVEQDGEVILSTDEDFLCADHTGFEAMDTVGYRTQFCERYTSGSPEEGFYLPDYDDSGWERSAEKRHVDYELFEQPSKMLDFELIEPRLIPDSRGVTVDLGGVYVGYLTVKARGQRGDVIGITCAQELDENGELLHPLRAFWRGSDRNQPGYFEEWVLSGGEDTLDQFDYKAIRYARLDLPEGCRVEDIKFIARHYPFELKAAPNFDDPELLPIWELCVNSVKYGVQEVIQDCMEREKGNYLGDGCYSALTHAILTGDPSMLKKLIDDSLRSAFVNRGLMTCAACSFMQEIAEYPLMMYFALYQYYRLSGDREYLERHYAQLCDILEFYRESYGLENGLLCNLDKWCVVEWPEPYRDGYDADIREGRVCTDLHSVINAHYIGAIRYMNRISDLLGRPREFDETPVLNAYLDAFYVADRKLIRDSARSEHISVVSNAFALMYGLYPDAESEEAIVEFIKQKGFTTVMLFGAFPILWGLKRTGRRELMLEFLKDDGAWRRMIREGATVTFEGWGKTSKWNTSLFHLTLSYAAVFLTDWEKDCPLGE